MSRQKYLSCVYLEQGLNIYKDHLTHCCVPHGNGKGNVDIGSFEGDRLPWELIQQAKQELIAQNQTEADTPCKGCPNLKIGGWSGNRSLGHITINDFYTCNLKCCYCFTQTESGVEHMKLKRTHDTLALFRDMVANDYLDREAIINWGGGEVAIYKHFEPIASLLVANGYTQFVNTNALVYSTVIEEGLRQGSMLVQISVDAGTPETYCQVKGVDAFEVVWQNLARYAGAGFVQVKYIVMEKNNSAADVQGFMDRCRRIGVEEVVVVPESSELVRGAISPATLEASVEMIHQAIRMKAVVNEDAGGFGPEYGAQIRKMVLERLIQDQAGSNKVVRNLAIPLGFNIRGLRRQRKAAMRRLRARLRRRLG